METLIVVKVRMDFRDEYKTQAIVKKVLLDDEGRFLEVYGLSKGGEWIRVPKGQPYSDECLLPVKIY